MNTTLTFGKYIDTNVRGIVDADRYHAFWLMAQPWFKARHPALFSELRRVLAKRLTAEVEEERRAAERRSLPPRAVSVAELCSGDDLA